MRVPFQTLLNQTRKAREASAHIGMAGREPNPYIARYGDRRSSTSRTRASASGSTCASTRMRRRLPRSISINPVRAAATERTRPSPAGKSFGVSSTSVATICTGAKEGTTCSDVRACRRHVNTRLAATPLRRATSVTFAPGANVSSTIRALSSRDQRRRRSCKLSNGSRSWPISLRSMLSCTGTSKPERPQLGAYSSASRSLLRSPSAAWLGRQSKPPDLAFQL
ncbi:hypothetical protein ACVW1C_005908 [Bradyrhizobium sp. USDA 4011]